MSAHAGVPIPAPAGWTPQAAIIARFPEIAELARQADPEIQRSEAELDRREASGEDASCVRQILRELRWRLQYTADPDGIRATLARLGDRGALPAATDAVCTDVWFLRLDGCVDRMLADDFDDHGTPPCLLDRINDPERLTDYLESLIVSRLEEDGIDRRKELNFATANLVRLILWRRPRNYPWDPRLEAVICRFVGKWQDPATGFFGADYLVGGRRLRTADLSLTFHMARYLEGAIGYWPQLVDTLFVIRDGRYPNGWLDEIGMTSHNNYDVAVLLQFGWPHMRAGQRQEAEKELTRLLDWCLTEAVTSQGEILARASGESLPESHYFTIAFLDTVGYFDPAKRFWSQRDFPEAPALRTRLEDRLATLPQGDPMVRMAYERLRPAGR
ncbi:MAG: hypothetical protein JO320_20435 [Alphaproteobacteria bacterium]|nr:hypothetical protein [Alphaproteobacteria bacterium]MBV9377387.1 hypothetical protein [Alphaproteobacteria bacterium]